MGLTDGGSRYLKKYHNVSTPLFDSIHVFSCIFLLLSSDLATEHLVEGSGTLIKNTETISGVYVGILDIHTVYIYIYYIMSLSLTYIFIRILFPTWSVWVSDPFRDGSSLQTPVDFRSWILCCGMFLWWLPAQGRVFQLSL